MSKKERLFQRFFEMYPGLFAWSVITCPIWGGIFFPVATAYFVLIFNAFWVYKSLSNVVQFIIGYFRIRNGENTDWMSKLKRLDNLDVSMKDLKGEMKVLKEADFREDQLPKSRFNKLPKVLKKLLFHFGKDKTLRYLSREIGELQEMKGKSVFDWKEVRHIIIVPFWREPYPVLKRSLDKLVAQTFPSKRISVVLGAEARHPPAYKLALRLEKEYEGKFENIWANNHEIRGDEVIGKASNMASCGKLAKRKIEEMGWDKGKITITSCDCDTQFDSRYFAYLTYLFVTDKNRYTHFYAAPMVYYANIWKVPVYSRVANTLFSVNNISKSVRLDSFIQVSSYSFPWKLLEDINFWAVDIIPEDFHMFFKALYLFGDDVMTVPIYLKNLADAAESIGHIGNIKNQYEQVKRWAWGVSDHGWMLRNLSKSKRKSLYVIYRTLHTIYDHLTWSIISFVLMFGANIPPLVNPGFSRTVLGQKLPRVSSFMLTTSSLGFVIILILDFFMKPRRDKKVGILQLILEQFQWLTFPLVSFVFGAIPGLDAQTRLLFGKYMEYRLTEKH